MNLTELQRKLFKEYNDNGYFEMWSRGFKSDVQSQEQRIYDLAEVGLINTEVSELMEDIRLGKEEFDEMAKTLETNSTNTTTKGM